MARKIPYDLPPHRVEYGVWLDPANLTVDGEVQRELDEKRAQTMADELIPEAVGALIVAQRADGSHVIIDGQHRHHACVLAGRTKVVCEVHYGLTLAQEGALFLIKNKESKRVSALAEFKVGRNMGVTHFKTAGDVLEKHGLDVGNSSPTRVGSVAAIVRIVETHGGPIFDRALAIASLAWGQTKETWYGPTLEGLADVCARHGGIITDKDLAKRMGRRTAYQWAADIRSLATAGGAQADGTGGRKAAARALIVKTWNAGRRTNLINPDA
ncbi:DUF6551 family protein [Streptomyces sp. NPDC050636]|uniref:DUF6551 family protein n=1 Tax=Streptomyces sp. NPDC050636 TaxID=3154510 RepID=UPI00344A37A2